jgi:putative transposase
MPWRLVDPMTERLRFLTDVRRRIASFTELCARYGVSRKTGYKWLHRAERDGTATLAEASRRPHTCPHAIAAPIVVAVLAARRRHPSWGPRKLLKLLRRRAPGQDWPARSTVADLLHRHGLVEPRRRRRCPGHPGRPLTPMTAPNGIWTADFKGQFKTGDGIYCYPLTVQDGFSCYLLACRGLTGPPMPRAGRCSSGSFGSTASPRSSAPITASPSPPARGAGCRSSASGGCGSGSFPS